MARSFKNNHLNLFNAHSFFRFGLSAAGTTSSVSTSTSSYQHFIVMQGAIFTILDNYH